MSTDNVSNLIFDKGAKNTLEKENIFNKWYWKTWNYTRRRMKLDLHLSSFTKTNSKSIKDLSLNPQRLELLEENADSSDTIKV